MMDGDYRIHLLDASGRPYYTLLKNYVAALDDQVKPIFGRALGSEQYFDSLAAGAHRSWLVCNYVQLGCGSLVTIVATLSGIFNTFTTVWAILTAILGAVIVLVRAIDSLRQNHEIWLRARATQQQLLAERIAFVTGTGSYAAASALEEYRSRTEAIINGESQAWITSAKGNQGVAGAARTT